MTAYVMPSCSPKSCRATIWGLRQGRERERLALEAGERRRVARQALRQHLHRHLALQAQVPGAVHLAHPARAQRGDDLVAVVQADARRDHAP